MSEEEVVSASDIDRVPKRKRKINLDVRNYTIAIPMKFEGVFIKFQKMALASERTTAQLLRILIKQYTEGKVVLYEDRDKNNKI